MNPQIRWSGWLQSRWFAAISLLLIAAAMVTLYLNTEYRFIGGFGFDLDDSWIHATIARNLAEGNGYSFNPGHIMSGSTAPLYTFLMALWYLVFGEVVWGGKLLGLAGLCVAATFLYLTAERYGDRLAAWVAAVLCVISPVMLFSSLGGMELGVYFISPCAAAYAFSRGKFGWMITALAIGVWLRPEAVMLLGLGWLAIPRAQKLKTLGIGALIVLPYFAFNYYLGQYPFPATVRTKSVTVAAHFSKLFLSDALKLYYNAHFWPLLILALAGFFFLWKKAWWIAVFPPLFLLAYWSRAMTSASFARYLHPTLPYVFLMMGLGLAWLRTRHELWLRRMVWVTPVLLLIQVWICTNFAGTYAQAVQNIDMMQVGIAKTFRAVTNPADTVATNDVGALGYFSHRYVLDLAGLVTPLLTFDTNLSRYRPAILEIFDSWFPDRLQSPTFRDDYELVGQVVVSPNVVCGDSIMSIYARKDRLEEISAKLESHPPARTSNP